MKRSHGKVVRTAVMGGELFFKISKRIEEMAGVKALLILAVAAFHLAVVARRIWPNQLVANAQFSRSLFKQRRQSRLLFENRLVNSKPLSVWTHSDLMPRRAYHFTSLFKKSAEE